LIKATDSQAKTVSTVMVGCELNVVIQVFKEL
jgi:hypothetical protein